MSKEMGSFTNRLLHSEAVYILMRLGVNWRYYKTISAEERLHSKKMFGEKIRKTDFVSHEEIERAQTAYYAASAMIYSRTKNV